MADTTMNKDAIVGKKGSSKRFDPRGVGAKSGRGDIRPAGGKQSKNEKNWKI
jgi:hypothetical protein